MNTKQKIREILENTCGQACTNGGGSTRPAVDQLLELVEEEKKKIIGDLEFRLIDNRVNPMMYPEMFEIMKDDIRIVRELASTKK